MERQLKLLEPADAPNPEWRLDESTKETGRRGLEAVRAALQHARRDARTADRRHDAA
jgi:hypothetical protein